MASSAKCSSIEILWKHQFTNRCNFFKEVHKYCVVLTNECVHTRRMEHVQAQWALTQRFATIAKHARVVRIVKHVKARGGWKSHAAKHKRVLVGLVAKCTGKPHFPDDAAGLVVEFYCPVGGS